MRVLAVFTGLAFFTLGALVTFFALLTLLAGLTLLTVFTRAALATGLAIGAARAVADDLLGFDFLVVELTVVVVVTTRVDARPAVLTVFRSHFAIEANERSRAVAVA
mgnify:CR=1 FL=1